ncbi:MAG: tripartite tricarboxylate transporter substrate binding protein, partial [Comamonadaceae bacterium]
MTLPRRTLLSLAALAPLASLAQPAFPRKPVKIIVNFAAGGPLDVMARVLAENLATRVGQPVIVDNVTGANGNLGVQALLRADADGHTLLF